MLPKDLVLYSQYENIVKIYTVFLLVDLILYTYG